VLYLGWKKKEGRNHSFLTNQREEDAMDSSRVKPAIWSAIGGAIAGMLVLSYGFGYMSPSAAKRIADAETEIAIIATLAPVCAEKFNALPDVTARKATLAQNKDSSWKMREAFPEALVTLPGKSYVDSDLVSACAKLVLAPPKSASLKQ
jgi:hypothetical protein